MELLDYFQKGGIVMYPLLLCSIIALGIFIERLLFYKRALGNEASNKKLGEALQSNDPEILGSLLKNGKSDCFELVKYYASLDQGDDKKTYTLETKANIMMQAYEEKLNILTVIITLAPLMGLLGTILGIIKSFSIFGAASDQPFAITAGIGEALIATGFGIIVAIFALLLHGSLKLIIAKLNRELEYCALNIIKAEK